MKIIDWASASVSERGQALQRPEQANDAELVCRVREILGRVKAEGDAALREYGKAFDKVDLPDFKVPSGELADASRRVDINLMTAMERARANIFAFHSAEYPKSLRCETMPGVVCELQWRPIEVVGLYVPGGSAPLFSSLIMEAIPAKIAGCKRVVLCSPPDRQGKINDAILAAAKMCGIEEVFAIGGAQAIAAMAYGTESVPKVDKIFGPGNAYVTAAKMMVSQDPCGAAIDMPAGPSEVMIIADGSSNPVWVAADLLAQAEHDANAQAILLTDEISLVEKVLAEIDRQVAVLPRAEIARKSLSCSRAIVARDIGEIIEIANSYAPEHLIIHNSNASELVPRINNAGSVFVGAWTPESAGDYASGTNHVLPTYGYARSYSGLSVLSFMKSMTVQSLSREGLRDLASVIVTMAEAEGLQAHANAVKVRMGAA